MESDIMYEKIPLIILLVSIVAVALLLKISFDIQNFSEDLKFINSEIDRAEGKEREYWKREKRRLWLSFIFPFLRF